ncbi:hypothetical protein BEWA_008830 [Theileria equi strain WA]|uniref:Uncharacterized protein n=1 Tax=Theileria equi strain WA TaxID=1537102 RepID=L0B2N1_THEEQ|nr:hypothetical protein BEWA_008830 [Theileria equi strain WA]AFZ81471.1 hypothetical protein BEWA_008830 [Theileria equi strain WA]|eukprot:XP_004831137.1 hypothetical protein BEWA_008830 [Theileria equi strain WA]
MGPFQVLRNIASRLRVAVDSKNSHTFHYLAKSANVLSNATKPRGVNDWNVFFSYLTYLKANARECKFRTCVAILINSYHYLLQYNKAHGFNSDNSLILEWNVGEIRNPGIKSLNCDEVEYLNPFSILKLLENLSGIRLFDRIYRGRPKVSKDRSSESIDAGKRENYDPLDNSKYSKLFQDIIDDIPENSFTIDPSDKTKNKGRLRYRTTSLISHPSILSLPFYFEVYNFEKSLPNSGYILASSNGFFVVEHVMAQFLYQVLVFLKTSKISPSVLCVLSTRLAVIVYGPKLRKNDNIVVTSKIDESFKNIMEYVTKTVISSDKDVSFRSLVYLVNTGLHNPRVLDYVSSRIMKADDPIDLHYIGKLTFVFTRVHYDNDKLYERLAQMINNHREYFTPTVTANLIFSFFRISKLDLVKDKLFNNLYNYQSEEYYGCKKSLKKSLLSWLESNNHTDLLNTVNAAVNL